MDQLIGSFSLVNCQSPKWKRNQKNKITFTFTVNGMEAASELSIPTNNFKFASVKVERRSEK